MATPGAAGDEHDVVVVSVSWTGERSAQVQGTSLLDVTPLSEVMEGTSGVSRSKRQPQSNNQQQVVQRESWEDGEEDEQEEVKKQAQRREDREEEK